ncbi:MAG: hypothetical protein V9E94_11860 [Microthrixaceae bacterium]
MSIFLGEQLADVFDQVARGGATESKEKGTLAVGVDTLPELPSDPGDRNRTSPLAFTGNRFEFRAVGSSQSIAGPMVAINTILAESLDHIATELEASIGSGLDFNDAVQQLLQAIITEHGSVVFNGDGYSDDWQVEAERRGLPNLRSTVHALPELDTDLTRELFSTYGVLNARELASRYEVYLEQYTLSIAVEARSLHEVASTIVLPAAVRYQSELAANVNQVRAAGIDPETTALAAVSSAVKSLSEAMAALGEELGHGDDDPGGQSSYDEAARAADRLLPAMQVLRSAADELENLVADDLWPLPTYQEMLFIL